MDDGRCPEDVTDDERRTLALWGGSICCKGIAEVQGLRSAWMGLVHVLAVIALVLVPFLLMAVTVRLVA